MADDPTQGAGSPGPDDTVSAEDARKAFEAMVETAVEKSREKDREFMESLVQQFTQAMQTQQAAPSAVNELDLLRQRLDDLVERLRERVFDPDHADLDKARTAVSQIEHLLSEELQIELPPPPDAKKAEASKTKAKRGSRLEKAKDSAAYVWVKELFTGEDPD